MKFYKKLMAEKALSFHEGTNKLLRMIMQVPVLKEMIDEDIFDKQKSKARMAVGIIYQLFIILGELVKKFVYFAVFIYIPCILMGKACPLIEAHPEQTMIYMFVILSVVCGSIANNIILALGDRDYLMIRICMVSPYMNFLSRLLYKMISDFISFTIILTVFGIPFLHSLLLSIVTVCARPIGEMLDIMSIDHLDNFYDNRSVYNGAAMALCVIFAYGVPILNKSVSSNWMIVVNPIFVVLMLLAGAGAMYYLWYYKDYGKIIREAIHIKHGD